MPENKPTPPTAPPVDLGQVALFLILHADKLPAVANRPRGDDESAMLEQVALTFTALVLAEIAPKAMGFLSGLLSAATLKAAEGAIIHGVAVAQAAQQPIATPTRPVPSIDAAIRATVDAVAAKTRA